MRILVVTPYYPPETGACATRMSELSRAWAGAGHEVHVLTGLPCYPSGVVPPEYRRQLHHRTELDGVAVHATWVFARPNASVLDRGLHQISVLASLAVGGLVVPEVDVVVATSPHILAAVAGAVAAGARRVPFVLEVRDLWPAVITDLGALDRRPEVLALLGRIEAWLYRRARGIVVVTSAFERDIRDRFPQVRGDAMTVITNGVDLRRWPDAVDPEPLRRELDLPADRPIALYAGTHGLSQGLATVVEAARRCPEVSWVLVGAGSDKAAIVEAGAGVPNLYLRDPLPSSRMPELYALADMGLVPLRRAPAFTKTIPSKIFELWAMRRPVLLGVQGEAADVVSRAGGGVAVPPEDPEALALAARALAADEQGRRRMGEAGRQAVVAEYDRAVLATRYLGFLERMLGSRR